MTLPDRLAHLPDRKRRELERAMQILFDEFEDAIQTKLSDYDLLVIVNEERFAQAT